ncbi:hypothetical protein GCM10010483_63090 [Actinokineospora diospyrosa]
MCLGNGWPGVSSPIGLLGWFTRGWDVVCRRGLVAGGGEVPCVLVDRLGGRVDALVGVGVAAAASPDVCCRRLWLVRVGCGRLSLARG